MGMSAEEIQESVAELAKRLSGKVSLSRLFPDEFIQDCSQAENIKAFLTPLNITSQETFDSWKDSELADFYIRQKTDFSSWGEMLNSTGMEYAEKKQHMLEDGTWVEETFDTGELLNDIYISLNFSPT